jgi:hypothetical protein
VDIQSLRAIVETAKKMFVRLLTVSSEVAQVATFCQPEFEVDFFTFTILKKKCSSRWHLRQGDQIGLIFVPWVIA